jgi:hypothetical protein
MKKISLIGVIISSLSLCLAHVGDHSSLSSSTDFSLYKNVQFIKDIDAKQPIVVEILNLSPVEDYVVVDDHGNVVQQQSKVIRKSTIIPPLRAEGCSLSCSDARMLLDGNELTAFDFSLASNGYQKGTITIRYNQPIDTDSISFQVTRDSYLPTSFALTIDGKRILNTIQGGSAHFPKMSARDVVIEFEYNQPIRFTEVGVGLQKEETVFGVVRFVYQPQEKYVLYSKAPTGKEHVAQSAIDLFIKNKEADGVLEEVRANPLYKERDSDGDGVVDSVDNCVMQANADQKDGNKNGTGDACDDYDYDGVATYRDNCSEMSNPDQKDTDKDGVGDVCDSGESRITEKYAWMPWLVFVAVLGAILAMGYEVIQMKKKREEGGK